mgnify:CR=1 FL=1
MENETKFVAVPEEKKENKVLSFFMNTLNGMAHGLFATLIIGTIFGTIGGFFKYGEGNEFGQMLHSYYIKLKHPRTNKELEFEIIHDKKTKFYGSRDNWETILDNILSNFISSIFSINFI